MFTVFCFEYFAVQADMPMAVDEKVAATPLAPRDYRLAAHPFLFQRTSMSAGGSTVSTQHIFALNLSVE
ncbi:MAG: hypothetical protein ACJAXK_000229 [Yoonia sp.]|jgi:hypothetical protein